MKYIAHVLDYVKNRPRIAKLLFELVGEIIKPLETVSKTEEVNHVEVTE